MISECASCCIVHKCANQKQTNVCRYHHGCFHLDLLLIHRCHPSLIDTHTMKKWCKRVPNCSFCSGTSKLIITKNVAEPLTKQVWNCSGTEQDSLCKRRAHAAVVMRYFTETALISDPTVRRFQEPLIEINHERWKVFNFWKSMVDM